VKENDYEGQVEKCIEYSCVLSQGNPDAFRLGVVDRIVPNPHFVADFNDSRGGTLLLLHFLSLVFQRQRYHSINLRECQAISITDKVKSGIRGFLCLVRSKINQ